ncbi:HAD family hydrolase [Deinococcus sonorensis]|uniref:HAD family hydrolase n=2 Tax=Deinococcus sonorensis TaxID=309891 RepID=A0AAU7U843_9DEIO
MVSLPKLLAFDLDGTLIPDGGVLVPLATRQALARVRDAGIQVAIITGRDVPPPDVLDAAQPVAVAGSNGGHILLNGVMHREARFTPADLRAVLAHQLHGARVIAFALDRVYVDLPPGAPVPEWLQRRPHAPLHEAPEEQIIKVGFWHPDIRHWRDHLSSSLPHLVLTGAQDPYPDFLTVTPSGADKGAALGAIAEALGLTLEQCWAFGDSDNDVAMLELAGHAVQVGRLPLLTPHADEVIEGPDQLGAFLNGLLDRLPQPARR